MSRFATPAQGTTQAWTLNDDRNVDTRGKWADTSNPAHRVPWTPGVLWAGSRFCGGGGGRGGPFLDDLDGCTARGQVKLEASGGQQQKYIEGTTRDSGGATLAGAIVQVFVTSTDTYVSEVTSDNAGYFRAFTQYTSAHYLVAYKAGSPDVAGTTVNTLTPT